MLGRLQLTMGTVRMKDETTSQSYTSVSIGSPVSMVMQYLDSALLRQWSYKAQGPTSGLGGKSLYG